MKRAAWVLSAVITVLDSNGQILQRPVAASYTGMGAYTFHHVDAFSFTVNQASLAQLKNTQAGIYGERRFLLQELGNYQAALAFATSAGNFGAVLNYYGFSAYREAKLGLVHARKLGDKLDVGIQLNYNTIRLAGYGKTSTVSAECGAVFHITGQLHSGIHISNPVGGKFGKDIKDKLPTIITIGIGYELSALVFITGEIVKEEDQRVGINMGVHYEVISQLYVRAGISSGTSSLWLGTGFSWKRLRLDIVNSYHPLLGLTPGLLLVFTPRSVKQKE